ncbi:MAG: CbiX/SirB N-terminal domain-containing protein, partial [Magnetococcales bacterium]|nr:CbiX/SirB N-terminal domain-containing protein [Magnetococcales bacterium]
MSHRCTHNHDHHHEHSDASEVKEEVDLSGSTVLIVGHGSRDTDGNDEIEDFADLWRKRHPDTRIEVCFIEFADILLDEGLDRAAKGSKKVVILPLILNAAGHVKMEIPSHVASARTPKPRTTASEATASITSDSLMPPTPVWITLTRICSWEILVRASATASTEPRTSALISTLNSCTSPRLIWLKISSS